MDGPPDNDDEAFRHFVMDMLVELVRQGAIPRETLERMMDTDKTRDNSVVMAKGRMAGGLLLEASVPPQSRRESEAQYRRRQIVERTALYERRLQRQRQADGGNEPG